MAEHPRGAVLRRAIETSISPDDDTIAKLGELFTDNATVWSPNVLAVGLADLSEILAFREVPSPTSRSSLTPSTSSAAEAWPSSASSATFSGPFVIDETTVIEPNGKQLLLGIAAVADFDGDKINALRAYFDDASLLEQMLDT